MLKHPAQEPETAWPQYDGARLLYGDNGAPFQRFLHFRGQVWELRAYSDYQWRDKWGCVYALRDNRASIDNVDRCGVWFFSLSEKHPLTVACRPHEYMYTSPTFQLYHTREQADRALYRYAKILGFPTVGKIFQWLSSVFGGPLWENEKTR